MNFDITQTPPNRALIDQERDRLATEERALKRKAYTLAAAAFVAGAGAGVSNYIDGKLSTLRKRRDALAPIPEESDLCVKIIEACKTHPECDAYRAAVAEQGRRRRTGPPSPNRAAC